MKNRFINTTEVTLNYKPKYQELSLSMGTPDQFVNFHWVPKHRRFDINQNPHGEPSLRLIQQFEFGSEYTQVAFQAKYQHEDTRFVLNRIHSFDQQALQLLAELPQK